jgi:hypothetical protein
MDNEAKTVQQGSDDDEEIGIWSIGIYGGETLFDLNPASGARNPVITAQDVSDIPAEFVADPFMIEADGTWHMFFEAMNEQRKKGEIGLATSGDGVEWRYERIVLREEFHLSYPYVFSAEGEYYMIPETLHAKAVRLYRGDPFPDKWSLVGPILDGAWADPSIFFHGGLWWMFLCPADSRSSRLDLYYAEAIGGPWQGHAKNPIVERDEQRARPGGRVKVIGERVIRFTQNCYPDYGTCVRAFEISELTASQYVEREVDQKPVLSGGGARWNRGGMHHIDAHWTGGRWLACVDGWRIEKSSQSREASSK